MNTKLDKKVVSISQYFRQECLLLTGLLETIENKDLEGTMLGTFEKLEVMADPSTVEDFHWIKSSNGAEKVIMKLSRLKDANKIELLKKV